MGTFSSNTAMFHDFDTTHYFNFETLFQKEGIFAFSKSLGWKTKQKFPRMYMDIMIGKSFFYSLRKTWAVPCKLPFPSLSTNSQPISVVLILVPGVWHSCPPAKRALCTSRSSTSPQCHNEHWQCWSCDCGMMSLEEIQSLIPEHLVGMLGDLTSSLNPPSLAGTTLSCGTLIKRMPDTHKRKMSSGKH